jgi:hypothetical protein
MKKWISSLAIVALLAVSSVVIYKEAFAYQPLCDQYQQQCSYCQGDFRLGDHCWEDGNGLTHCDWYCDTYSCSFPCSWPCPAHIYGTNCIL